MHTSGKSVEFLFDFGSPTTYLAFHVLRRIAERHDAEIRWTPVLLGGIFQLSGNVSPALHPAKGRWMMQDLQRWADQWDVPFRPRFPPASTLALARGAVAALEQPHFLPYCEAVFDALWRDGEDLAIERNLKALLERIGWPPPDFHAAITSPAIKAALHENTRNAVARGVFGAPTFFVGNEMHFGQDRMMFVEKALLSVH